MNFLNPILLWSLLGLAIPVAIHLLSRKEGRVIKIGSLRHLQETSTRQFKSIRINEIFLLTLRCVVMILFCLLLAGLYTYSSEKRKWAIIESGLETNKISILDSLKKDGYEIHKLSAGLPLLSSDDTTRKITYRDAIKTIELNQLEEAVVFSKNSPEKLVGPKLIIPSNIKWISEPADSTDFILQSQLRNDTTFVRTGKSSQFETSFADEIISGSRNDSKPMKVIKITVVSENRFNYDQRLMLSILEALKQSFNFKFEITESKKIISDTDWTIWLSGKELPEINGGVIFITDQPSDKVITQIDSHRWMLSRLNEDIILRDNLPLKLAEIMLPGRADLTKIANDHDRRMMPDSVSFSISDHAGVKLSTATTAAQPWLLAVLFLVLVTERIVSYHKNQ